MARDMGLGLRAYLLTRPEDSWELREIFETGPEVIPSTVEEQTAFANQVFDACSGSTSD